MYDRPILFAYDGSPNADAALDLAVGVLQQGSALVASVWLPVEELISRPFAVSAATNLGEFDVAAEDEATAIAARGAERVGAAGFRAEAVALRGGGPIWRVIVDFARERDARVIVIGSRGRHGASEILLGSVSARVADHADRPVFIGHPPSGQLS